jgi:hypothetical protein
VTANHPEGGARRANPWRSSRAHAAFLAFVPKAVGLTRGEISARANPMIAAAINADPQWFWRGPDR